MLLTGETREKPMWQASRLIKIAFRALACAYVTVAHAQEGELPRSVPSMAQALRGAHELAKAVDAGLQSPTLLAAALGGPRSELAITLFRAHTLSGLHSINRAREAWTRVDVLAAPLGAVKTHIYALEQRTELALLLGDYRSCHALANELLKIARTQGNRDSEATALGYIGIVERRRGNLDSALESHSQALALMRDSANPSRLALVISNLGTVHRDRGDFAKALELQLEALEIRERVGDRVENSLRNIALLYREIEDEQNARSYFARAIELAQKNANPQTFAPALGSYASLLNDLDDHAGALDAANEALAIETVIGNRSNLGLEMLEIARAYAGLGRRSDAINKFEEALQTGRELGQREIVARALLHLSELAQSSQEYLRARGMIDEAIAELEVARLRPQLAQAYAVRERIALAQRDPESALRYLRRYGEQRELLLGTRAGRQLGALQARYARAEAEQAIVLLQKENELQNSKVHTRDLEHKLGLVAGICLLIALALSYWRYAGVNRLNRTLSAKNIEIDSHRQALGEANVALAERARALYQASISDPLTRVYNRTYLREDLARRIEVCLAENRPLALFVIDFDHFKQINDSLGHLYGDRVLIAGVEAMRACLAPGDLLGRFGGEEFVIAIEDRDQHKVRLVAEQLREQVRRALTQFDALGTAVTISVGVALLSRLKTPSVDALLDAGDRAMYKAKAAGRNRVVDYV